MTQAPPYSVVILTYNRAKLLALALRSVIEQIVPRESYEILVIDDASTDNTSEVVKQFINKHPEYTIFYHKLPHGGQARCRNISLQLARGEFIFFLDDDCIVPPSWISHHAKIYALHPEVMGVGGTYIAPPKILAKYPINRYNDTLMFRYGTLDTIDKCSSSFSLNTGVGNAANVSYRRWTLLAVGGFDEEQKSGVDFQVKKLIMNRGWQLYYTPMHAFHLKEYRTLRQLFSLGMYRGRGVRFYYEKNSDLKRISYGYPSWKHVAGDAQFIRSNAPRVFVFYHWIESIGKWLGWQQLRFFGPHSDVWQKAQETAKQNRKLGTPIIPV